MSGVVLLNPLSIFSIESSLKPSISSTIQTSNLTNSPQSLSHRCLVADPSLFYCYFHGHCSLEIKTIFPNPVRRVRTNRSSTHSHPFQVTLPDPQTLAHISYFIPRTSQLWSTLPSNAFPNPKTYHPSKTTSTNLILFLI